MQECQFTDLEAQLCSPKVYSFVVFSCSQIKHSTIKVPYKHRVAGTRKTGNIAFDLVLNESSSQVVFAAGKSFCS